MQVFSIERLEWKRLTASSGSGSAHTRSTTNLSRSKAGSQPVFIPPQGSFQVFLPTSPHQEGLGLPQTACASNEGLPRPRVAFSTPPHREWPDHPSTARMGRAQFYRARVLCHTILIRGWPGWSPYCARPTRVFRGRALREHRRPSGQPHPSHSCISVFSPRTMTNSKLTLWHSDCFGVPDRYKGRLHAG